MLTFDKIKEFLYNYDGEPVTLMEVCGTHTSVIAKSGIKSLLSDKIKLVSGPGCPVCVTVSSYIDKLCELSLQENTVVVTFGDMMRVKGSERSLNDMMAAGGKVKLIYSPLELLKLAKENKNTTFIFAAVGFETTTPIYAMLIRQAIEKNIHNIKLLSSLKTMPEAIDWICRQNHQLTGFIAPGHVCAITGSDMLVPFAEKYHTPLVVAGFSSEQVLSAVYMLTKLKKTGKVINLYRSAVEESPNMEAKTLVDEFFESGPACWRGLGTIEQSGLYLKGKYSEFDAGSRGLTEDVGYNNACRCSDVITGKISPHECALFGKACTPQNPQGACMVSEEGSCHSYFTS
ncbi:MAG: hydrogenase expression/formation protein HypD [Oscillospiraceae bacterium]|nr:hydrogenase expression/formation protein HypD [Oscillospiraceae bacterium]